MNAKDAIRSSANLSTMVLKTYISDLDDADLMRRPGVTARNGAIGDC